MSRTDPLTGFGGLVYGAYTSRILEQDAELIYDAHPDGRFCVPDLSVEAQLEMICRDKVTAPHTR